MLRSTIFKMMLLLLLAPTLGRAQTNTIVSYQYWFDDDTTITQVSLNPSQTLILSDSVNTTGLDPGLHQIHFRVKDQEGFFSTTLHRYCIVPGNAQINLYEYWVDEDYGSKVSVQIAPLTTLFLLDTAVFQGLDPGFHLFHARMRDHRLAWTPTISQYFIYYPPQSPTSSNQLTTFEYWFNDNPSSHATLPFTGNLLVHQIDIDSLEDGFNKVHVRFKDLAGHWTPVQSSYFIKYGNYNNSPNALMAYQYWLNDQTSQIVTVPVTGSLITGQILIDTMPMGYNELHVRFKDQLGEWSVPLTYVFFRFQNSGVADNKLMGYRYWIDNDWSTVVDMPLSPFTDNLLLIDSIVWYDIDLGNHLFHLQFYDSLERFTHVITDTFFYMPIPRPIFTASPTEGCDSLTVIFTDSSIDADTYLWHFGDGDSSTVQNPVHHYATPGLYNVSLTVYNNQTMTDSTVTISQFVKVHPSPVPSLGPDTGFCTNSSFVLNPGAGSYTYLWSDQSTASTLTVTQGGTYWVKITDQHTCFGYDTVTVVVYPLPTANAGLDADICIGDCITLIGSGGLQYSWSSGSLYDTTQVCPQVATDYILTVWDQNNCSDIDTVHIDVNPLPFVDLGLDTGFCTNDSLTLTPGSGFNSYLWSNQNTTATITVTQGGSYWVKVSDQNACFSSDTVNVLMYPLPPIDAGSDVDICIGDCATLIGSGGIQYSWSTGSQYDTTIVCPSIATDYYLTGWNQNSCSNTDTVNVGVNPLPSVDLGPDTTVCVYHTVVLDPGIAGASYYWSNGATTPSIEVDSIMGGGLYWVQVTDANGCVNSDTIQVTFSPCYSIEEFEGGITLVMYPNPVTKLLHLKLTHAKGEGTITIVDQLGQFVLTTQINASNPTLEHTIDMSHLPSGVYFIRIVLEKGVYVGRVVKH